MKEIIFIPFFIMSFFAFGQEGLPADNQPLRPLLEIQLGTFSPIIFGPENWTTTNDGLALRYGYGGELGISINPIKYLGITVSHGFTNHFSFLPEMPGLETTTVNKKEKINLMNRPSSIKLNLYLKEDIILSSGLMFSHVSISNSDPEVINEPMNGYTFGLGKIFQVGNKKNYISLTANCNIVNTEGFTFSLDQKKFPDVDPLNLEFKTLNTIDLKLQFHFGIIN